MNAGPLFKIIAGFMLLACAATQAAAATLKDICSECRFEKFASCGEFLEGINFDRNGHAWATSIHSGDLLEVVDGRCEVRYKTGGNPNGARFDKQGRLFVTDARRGVLIFDPGTKSLTVFADKVGDMPMVSANDLVFDSEGGLYVTIPAKSNLLSLTGQVVYFAPGSKAAVVVADNLPYPNGITIHPDGKFINVALFGMKLIMTVPSIPNADSRRGPYVLAHTEGGVGPDGLAMDEAGRTYWAEFMAGAVGVADSDGFIVGYLKLPGEAGRNTSNLAFHDGYLYVTEADKGDIWRVPVHVTGQRLYGEQITAAR